MSARLVIPCHYEMFAFNTADEQLGREIRPVPGGGD